MIENLYLRNFKCFKEQEFKFSPLTVFCGSNSAGKSTAIQSLLCIKQNIEHLKYNKFRLDGELFSFGLVSDLLSHNPIDNNIVIGINEVKLVLDADSFEGKECLVKAGNINHIDGLSEIFTGDFVYLCAERFGPRASFEIGSSNDQLDIGIYGQYALSAYYKFQDKPAKNQPFAQKICNHLLGENKEQIFTSALVREAMRKICPGFAMRVIEASEIDRVYSLYVSGSSSIRPINVGFGVSYVLPIVISAALIQPGGTLIVENPEVHLHPAAQSSLVEILCFLAETGVQVIIETHSDHIINGIRVFAKKHDGFNKGMNIIHSISDDVGERKVKEIHVDNDGNLTALDKGFFDQITKDLMSLF